MASSDTISTFGVSEKGHGSDMSDPGFQLGSQHHSAVRRKRRTGSPPRFSPPLPANQFDLPTSGPIEIDKSQIQHGTKLPKPDKWLRTPDPSRPIPIQTLSKNRIGLDTWSTGLWEMTTSVTQRTALPKDEPPPHAEGDSPKYHSSGWTKLE